MTFETSTIGSAATKDLGRRLARHLKGGEVVELVSDLGGGKTTLAKGLVAGLGYDGDVPSPTFTVSRVYPVRDGLEVHHFDFYRLGTHDIVSDQLTEVMGDPKAITVIEWAEHGAGQLPDGRISIDIVPGKQEDERLIKLSGPEKLIDELKHDIND
ncbi:MAG TPA: tRNA (adenosine(37)-N6)-threonylcarbamoyltransferase complex ATPase subunit type 1 TsaE [Candidatus Saccharimonadales bacterium]|nr:tRNA (adenosine(37)-N6)-threonylcarbamoyltransferase complex ATPase subunit type 1 TsaE [Candidatus Saccharimonadales bacterium]